MSKTGRRSKGDMREVKSERTSVALTKSQRDKLNWLTARLQKSIPDLVGSWIEQVFDALGGDLSISSDELQPKHKKLLDFLERCQSESVSDFEVIDLAQQLDCDERLLKRLRDCLQTKERGKKDGVDQR